MGIQDKSVIICSIVRDAEKGLRKNIPVIKDLCSKFNDYKVVIFENDSHDRTKQLLSQWKTEDPERVYAFMYDTDGKSTIPSYGEVKGNPFFSHERNIRMASFRNQYMDLIWQNGWTADYIIVVDLDVAEIDLDGVLSSFCNDNWDAVTAFGYSRGPNLHRRYHDTYALQLFDSDKPQTEKEIFDLRKQFASFGDGDQWVRVASAFGGLTIYRMETIEGLRYIVYENDDPDVTVRCEHFSIYKQMRERGFDRVYINPKMKIKYQSFNIQQIIKAASNRLDKIFHKN